MLMMLPQLWFDEVKNKNGHPEQVDVSVSASKDDPE